jgi:hypothetical protein
VYVRSEELVISSTESRGKKEGREGGKKYRKHSHSQRKGGRNRNWCRRRRRKEKEERTGRKARQ